MAKRRLGDICNVVTGSTPKTNVDEFWDGDIKWITPAELTEDSYVIEDSERKITELAVKKTGLSSFPEGTVILSSRAPIGKVAIAGCEMYCNQGFKNLICTEEIYNEYLYWFLKSKKDYLISLGRGATFKEISKTIVENIEIELPKMEVQKEIAKQLKKCNEIIVLRRKELLSMEHLIKSRFVELFGDPKSNNKKWKRNTFADICSVRQGLQIPISKRLTQYEEGCYEYITVAYLHGSKEREYIKKPKSTVICTKDDILMTRTGNTGMVITDVAGVFHNNFFLIDFDRTRYNKVFLAEYLNLDLIQAEIRRRAGTSTIPDLNHGEFYAIAIYEPPIALQKQFAAFVEQTDKSKFEVQKSLDETQKLMDSLMQQYFE